jgi:hypothetical protein
LQQNFDLSEQQVNGTQAFHAGGVSPNFSDFVSTTLNENVPEYIGIYFSFSYIKM